MSWVIRRTYNHSPHEFFYISHGRQSITAKLEEAALYEKSAADEISWYISYGGSIGWKVVEYGIALIEEIMRS